MRCLAAGIDQNTCKRDENSVVLFICHADAWHMERHVQCVEKTTTSKRSAEGCKALTHKKNAMKVNINSMNINSIMLNSKCSVITANLKTSSSQASFVVPYKVDSCSNGNIMPFHIFRNLYLRSTKEQLAAIKNENIKLRIHNSITITQLGRCTVEMEKTK